MSYFERLQDTALIWTYFFAIDVTWVSPAIQGTNLIGFTICRIKPGKNWDNNSLALTFFFWKRELCFLIAWPTEVDKINLGG